MSDKNESKLTKDFCTALTEYGALCVPLVGSTRQRSGLPDRAIWHLRWCGHIEFKKPPNKPDADQVHYIKEINKRRPCAAFIGWHLDERRLLLQWFLKTPVVVDDVLSGYTQQWFAYETVKEPVEFFHAIEAVWAWSIAPPARRHEIMALAALATSLAVE